MADINQVTTLGIGTPGAIPEFLTFGLQLSQPASGGLCATFTMAPSLTSTNALEPILTTDIDLDTC